MSKQTFVIVGASLAGAKAAETLREQGFDGRLLLIGAEHERPYERPPLTKDYLRGESEREKAYVHPESFYAEHDIEFDADTTVTAIDPAASRVTLDDGRAVEFDRLLLTIGAEPRRISVPGADLDGVYYLRTLADCDLLRERLDAGGHVVVVGAGWIGSEFAASARQRGLRGDDRRPLALPNERIFGPEIGAFYRDAHGQHGVELMLGDGVEAFEGDGGGGPGSDGRRHDDRMRLRGRRASASRRASSWRATRASRSTTGSSSTSTSTLGAERVRGRRRRQRVASVLRRADPRRALGQRAATRGRRRRAQCSASRSPTTGSRTSSPTSTTSEWSTRATRPTWDEVVFRGDPSEAGVHRLLAAATAGCWPA